MKVEYFDSPSPHYIIDEFLPPVAARKILQECIDLESSYEQAIVGGENNHQDDCDECKLIEQTSRSMIRDNQLVYLNLEYKNRREKSSILNYLHQAVKDVGFVKIFKSAIGMFPIINIANCSETMVSRYGKCDFYGWHTDSQEGLAKNRVVTISYYVNKEPVKFKGGDLLIMGENGTIKKIIPKHNRAIIFMSSITTHAVDSVDLKGKVWDEGRFSVQFWLGFNDEFEFR